MVSLAESCDVCDGFYSRSRINESLGEALLCTLGLG